jgi:hypothetical protein|nr:MAG TPA_asm: hypothetical protein [Caudoviricetes sp.]DAM28869.1 MAG TPA: hypothetical protein [Caudoviricetes sp.]
MGRQNGVKMVFNLIASLAYPYYLYSINPHNIN